MTCSSVLFLALALLASPGAEASNSTRPEPSSTEPQPLLHAQAKTVGQSDGQVSARLFPIRPNWTFWLSIHGPCCPPCQAYPSSPLLYNFLSNPTSHLYTHRHTHYSTGVES